MFIDKNGHELKIGDYVKIKIGINGVDHFGKISETEKQNTRYPCRVNVLSGMVPGMEDVGILSSEIILATKEEIVLWRLEN